MAEQRARGLVEEAMKSLSQQGKSVLPSYLGGVHGGPSTGGGSLAQSVSELSEGMSNKGENPAQHGGEGSSATPPSVELEQNATRLSLCSTVLTSPSPSSSSLAKETIREDPALVEAANFLWVSEKTDLRNSTDLMWLRHLLRTAMSAVEYVQQTAKTEVEKYALRSGHFSSEGVESIPLIPCYLPLVTSSSAYYGHPFRDSRASFPRPLLFHPSSEAQHRIKKWCLEHEDDCRRRIRELEAQAAHRDYAVQYDPGKNKLKKLTLPCPSSWKQCAVQHGGEKGASGDVLEVEETENERKEDDELSTNSVEKEKTLPLVCSPRTSVFSREEEVVREEALLGRQNAPRCTFPNRSFHGSDVVRYPLLECTNTIGLECKEAILRSAHQQECRRCGAERRATADHTSPVSLTATTLCAVPGAGDTMCFSRYFNDVDAEYRVPVVRKLFHERTVLYERSKDSACIIADALELLNTEKGKPHQTQLEKDLAYRESLSDAASSTLASVHRLRQEGFYGRFLPPNDAALPYAKAFREAHLSGKEGITLPPVTCGDGHEGHFYL